MNKILRTLVASVSYSEMSLFTFVTQEFIFSGQLHVW